MCFVKKNAACRENMLPADMVHPKTKNLQKRNAVG